MAPAAEDLLADAYRGITAVVEPLSPADFLRRTGAEAWCVQDLVFHLLLDAQRALVAAASPAGPPSDDEQPDVDAASYWGAFRPDVDPEAAHQHARFVRRAAAAYREPAGLVAQWRDTADAAARALGCAPACVRTQGHVLIREDLISTLVVEACVHHLDLVVELPGAQAPSEAVTGHTRSVLERIAGAPLPASWPDDVAVRIATGRQAPPPHRPHDAGVVSQRFPLLG